MTDEAILETELLEDIPDDHRPDDAYIAAKLRVDNEFKRRVGASIQRKFKRNFQGGIGTGYTTSDEIWCHFKPTEEQLEKWIKEEGRGEARIDEHAATSGDGGDDVNQSKDDSGSRSEQDAKNQATLLSDADQEQRSEDSEGRDELPTSSRDEDKQCIRAEDQSSATQGKKGTEADGHSQAHVSAAASADASNDTPQETWLGILPSLRDGPQKS